MIQKFFVVFIVTILSLTSWGQARNNNGAQRLEITKPISDTWEKDFEINDLFDDGRHYLFKGQEKIDLNITVLESDVLGEIEAKGLDFFIEESLKGANFVNDLFNLNKVEKIEAKFIKSNSNEKPSIVTFQSQQKIDGSPMLKMSSKYFLIPGAGYHLQLRWSSDADPQDLKEAQELFEKIIVEAKTEP